MSHLGGSGVKGAQHRIRTLRTVAIAVRALIRLVTDHLDICKYGRQLWVEVLNYMQASTLGLKGRERQDSLWQAHVNLGKLS